MSRLWPIIVLILNGCAAFPRAVDDTRLPANAYDVLTEITVPIVSGRDGCGAQALAAALAALEPGADAEAIAAALPWHDEGATPVDLLLAARAAGAQATIAAGTWQDLESHVAARRVALVMVDAAPEVRTLTTRIPTRRVMHWAVVTGFRRDGSAILFGAPGRRHAIISRDAFLARWDASDRCVITIEPGR